MASQSKEVSDPVQYCQHLAIVFWVLAAGIKPAGTITAAKLRQDLLDTCSKNA